MLWLDCYKERYDREPPVSLAEYAFPMKGISKAKQDKIMSTIDAVYERLREAALVREFQDKPKDDVFFCCPKGLSKAHNDALKEKQKADLERAKQEAATEMGSTDEPVIVPVPIDD